MTLTSVDNYTGIPLEVHIDMETGAITITPKGVLGKRAITKPEAENIAEAIIAKARNGNANG